MIPLFSAGKESGGSKRKKRRLLESYILNRAKSCFASSAAGKPG
jgi:hypothetical protein